MRIYLWKIADRIWMGLCPNEFRSDMGYYLELKMDLLVGAADGILVGAEDGNVDDAENSNADGNVDGAEDGMLVVQRSLMILQLELQMVLQRASSLE